MLTIIDVAWWKYFSVGEQSCIILSVFENNRICTGYSKVYAQGFVIFCYACFILHVETNNPILAG